MGEEVVDLAGPDVFTGEHYVAAAVDYQGWVGGDVSEVVVMGLRVAHLQSSLFGRRLVVGLGGRCLRGGGGFCLSRG